MGQGRLAGEEGGQRPASAMVEQTRDQAEGPKEAIRAPEEAASRCALNSGTKHLHRQFSTATAVNRMGEETPVAARHSDTVVRV
jgi:hypothetical protein